ncbi:hypothetical protein [Candidatus Palauibacter sp.]|uniref:hypothetical protein n=1 Tax=Candidatus Palauibacter sp. TaxID=3101350 RepID=UPI003B025D78
MLGANTAGRIGWRLTPTVPGAGEMARVSGRAGASNIAKGNPAGLDARGGRQFGLRPGGEAAAGEAVRIVREAGPLPKLPALAGLCVLIALGCCCGGLLTLGHDGRPVAAFEGPELGEEGVGLRLLFGGGLGAGGEC